MIPVGFDVTEQTYRTLAELAGEQGLTVAQYLRSIAGEHVAEKVRMRGDIARARQLVEDAHGPD